MTILELLDLAKDRFEESQEGCLIIKDADGDNFVVYYERGIAVESLKPGRNMYLAHLDPTRDHITLVADFPTTDEYFRSKYYTRYRHDATKYKLYRLAEEYLALEEERDKLKSQLTKRMRAFRDLSISKGSQDTIIRDLKAKIKSLEARSTKDLKNKLVTAMAAGLCANEQTKYGEIPRTAIQLAEKILEELDD